MKVARGRGLEERPSLQGTNVSLSGAFLMGTLYADASI